MRIRVIIVLFLLFGFFSANSQELHSISIGPYVSMKAGINGGNVQDGRQNGIAFTGIPDFGVSSFMLLSDQVDLAVTCDFGYSRYAYQIKGYNVGKNYNLHYGYLTLNPNFHFAGFFMGFNFGYPLHADFGATIDNKILDFMVEFRAGAMLPLMIDQDGSLNLVFTTGYMFTGIYKNFPEDDPLRPFIPWTDVHPVTSKYNHRALSVSLGISYLFNL